VLMMWGVINFTVQFNQWRLSGDVDLGTSWTWSWIFSAIASLLPFVYGVLLLKSVLFIKTNVKPSAVDHSTKESQT
jgi:hypothetical protein